MWVTGRWPRCVRDLSRLAHGDSGNRLVSSGVTDVSCAIVHAQQWSALLFIVYVAALAFTFLDRYDSLAMRGPLSNKVLCSVTLVVLVVHAVVGGVVVHQACGGEWHEVLNPTWQMWVVFVAAWPLVAVVVAECAKRRDRRYHMHLQKTLRVLFNTRLGMWSPK